MLKSLAKIQVKVSEKDGTTKNHTRCEIMASSDEAVIRIIGEISWWKNSSEEFIAQMDAIKSAGIRKLKCYINSGGGSVWDANEIYNQLVAFDGEKKLEIGAICASAATIVAMAFKKEDTEGASNLAYMIHNPRTSVWDAEVKDLETGIQLLTNTKETISKLYQKRTGLGKTQIANKMDSTWWMTAEIAKENGFIGSIKGESDTLPEDTGEVFNRYKYDNIPSVLNSALKPDKSELPELKNENEKFTITMKDFVTLLLATMTGLTNVIKSDASHADVVAGLKKAFDEKDSKITELTNDLKTEKDKVKKLEDDVKVQNDAAIKELLDSSENEKKITKDLRAELEKQAPTIGLTGIKTILNAMPKRTSVKDAIENDGGKKTGAGKKEKETEEEEEREEPKYSEGENGRRIYNDIGGKSQREVMQRAFVKNKASRSK